MICDDFDIYTIFFIRGIWQIYMWFSWFQSNYAYLEKIKDKITIDR